MVSKAIVCDRCKNRIEPNRGLSFKGNVGIVTKDADTFGGVIGNNFPVKGQVQRHTTKGSSTWVSDQFSYDDINQSDYCLPCFFAILHYDAQEGMVGLEPPSSGSAKSARLYDILVEHD